MATGCEERCGRSVTEQVSEETRLLSQKGKSVLVGKFIHVGDTGKECHDFCWLQTSLSGLSIRRMLFSDDFSILCRPLIQGFQSRESRATAVGCENNVLTSLGRILKGRLFQAGHIECSTLVVSECASCVEMEDGT